MLRAPLNLTKPTNPTLLLGCAERMNLFLSIIVRVVTKEVHISFMWTSFVDDQFADDSDYNIFYSTYDASAVCVFIISGPC